MNDASQSGIALLLVLTARVSLQRWQHLGMLQRELALYRRLRPHLQRVTMLSYGGKDDMNCLTAADGFELLVNRRELPWWLFSLVAPLIYRREFKACSIIKTNQFNGAWTGALGKRLYRRPLIVRGGYAWSLFLARRGFPLPIRLAGHWIERWSLQQADHVIVPDESTRAFVTAVHNISAQKVTVVPNYVDTTLFAPSSDVLREPLSVTTIANMAPQKNIESLIICFEGLAGTLRVIGDGPGRSELANLARSRNIQVEFLGTVPNEQLPTHLNRTEIFVLPSLYEGHPKSLLEAMACGCPVVGADVPGINTVIDHRRTGFLSPPTPEGLRAAITQLRSDRELRRAIGTAAHDYVESTCSLTRVLELEMKILRSLVS